MADDKDLIKEFLTGGWLVALVGAAGMVARLLTDASKMPWVEQFKKILAASICSIIAWFMLEQTDISSLTKAIIYGVVGVISPELLQGLARLAKQVSKNPEKFIKKDEIKTRHYRNVVYCVYLCI
jgi:hypothetical protein